MINKAIIMGRVGKDPEIKTTSSGAKFCNLTVATSEVWKNKEGKKEEKTEWHNITIWNEKLIDNLIAPYVVKGSLVYIEGKITTVKSKDDKYYTGISIKGMNDVFKLLPTGQKQQDSQNSIENSTEEVEMPDDDIPF